MLELNIQMYMGLMKWLGRGVLGHKCICKKCDRKTNQANELPNLTLVLFLKTISYPIISTAETLLGVSQGSILRLFWGFTGFNFKAFLVQHFHVSRFIFLKTLIFAIVLTTRFPYSVGKSAENKLRAKNCRLV